MRQKLLRNALLNSIVCTLTIGFLANPARGCDCFVIKRGGTADGSIIMTALYEWELAGESYPIIHADRRTYPAGSTVRLSDRYIPQVSQTWAYNYIYSRYFGSEVPLVAHAINEWGVAIGSTSICSTHVDSSKYKPDGVDFTDCNRIVAERATSAEEGVNIIGQLIDAYSYTSTAQDKDFGQEWIIADTHDAWVVECVGPFWLARRITEIFFNCTNALTITNSWDKGSADVVNYAIGKGWCTDRSDFNWQKFADPLGGCYERYNAIRNYLTNPSRLGQITPQTVKDMMRDPAVGGFDWIAKSQAATIFHLRPGAPGMLKNKAWFSARAPYYNKLFIPLYACDQAGIAAKLGLPGLDYWNSSSVLLQAGDCGEYEKWTDSITSDMERQVADKLNQGKPDEALQLLEDYNIKVGEQAWGMYNRVPIPDQGKTVQ